MKIDDEKINEINQERKWANGKMIKMDSKVFKTSLELEKETFKDGALSKKNKELIAVGISAMVNCESCMQWHITEAYKDGATEKEIIEAIEVAYEMGVGSVTVNSRFGLEVMESLYHGKEEE
jgi:AhpD family alkylhydroperoxidase